MKKEVNMCDICEKNIADSKCEMCGKDICNNCRYCGSISFSFECCHFKVYISMVDLCSLCESKLYESLKDVQIDFKKFLALLKKEFPEDFFLGGL